MSEYLTYCQRIAVFVVYFFFFSSSIASFFCIIINKMDNFDDAVLALVYIIIENARRNSMRIERRHLRDTKNPFEITDFEFLRAFRLNKHLARDIITQLEPHAHVVQRTSAIPFHFTVLTTLNFLSTGSYQRTVGNSAWTTMSQTSVCRAIGNVCQLLTDVMMPQTVRFPTTLANKNSTKQGFYEKTGFRGVIGCIDGTHVEIVAPPSTDEDHPPHLYINRKGVHSINVMLICDSNCQILACDARYPGSVHDSAVWLVSDIRRYLKNQYQNGDQTTHLLGDSGYPLEPWLFTPVTLADHGTPASRFNDHLRSTRNVIERTNGLLKARFRCLLRHRVLHYHPAKAAYVIYAAIVLHNLAVRANIGFPDDEEIILENANEEPPINNQHDGHEIDLANRGRLIRDNFIRNNYA